LRPQGITRQAGLRCSHPENSVELRVRKAFPASSDGSGNEITIADGGGLAFQPVYVKTLCGKFRRVTRPRLGGNKLEQGFAA
jgi:hypothetical protein